MMFDQYIDKKFKPLISGYWQQFIDVITQNNLFSLKKEILDIKNKPFFSRLLHTWISSDFFFLQCIKQPSMLEFFLTNNDPSIHFTYTKYKKNIEDLFNDEENELVLMQKLRLYRNHIMACIIWYEVNHLVNFYKITHWLSDLADACADYVLNWLYNDLSMQFGTPSNKKGIPQKMVVLAMGKLGARELNLSSDIDLIFSYPESGTTLGKSKLIDNKEFFTRLGQRLIKVLDQTTEDGFVFRVDMRLRPYGDSGSLVMSLVAMEQYYQDHGRDWERYAMIKARVIAGDIQAGKQFLKTIKPFMFRRYIDFSILDSLRAMKEKIQRTVLRDNLKDNIKRGHGGIREIEFITQSFQLIHGGRFLVLQSRSLIYTLNALRKFKFIDHYTANILKNAYLFLRKLEHALQAMHDHQTHELPTSHQMKCRIAHSMQYKTWNELKKKLTFHRNQVISIFEKTISNNQLSAPISDEWGMLWNKELNVEDEIKLMSRYDFNNVKESHLYLITFRDGDSVKRTRRQSLIRLQRFMPLFLHMASRSIKPDTCLVRVIPLIENILRRTSYLVLLYENPKSLEYLCYLSITSSWLADYIAKYPAMLDEFLYIKNISKPPIKSELVVELEEQLNHVFEDDLEAQMEILRYFKMTHVLRMAISELVSSIPLMKESDYYTWIAEAIVAQIFHISWKNMVKRYGYTYEKNIDFLVIGYGKLGGIEMGPSSDLDLVFIHENRLGGTNGDKSIDCNLFFSRLAQRVIHMLTIYTVSDCLYEVDLRLRPSGQSGLLVTSIDAFEKYQKENAWLWEHQALVRARSIAGDNKLANRFELFRKKILSEKRDIKYLKDEVFNMRERLKKKQSVPENKFHFKYSDGGIIDIEFLMQYAVLAFSHTYPNSINLYSDNIRICQTLEKNNILTKEESKAIQNSYKFLRKSSHIRSFQNKSLLVDKNEMNYKNNTVNQLWQQWILS